LITSGDEKDKMYERLTACVSQKAKEVIGVDMLETCVNDAKANAEKNGITNCEFVQGRAEETIGALIKKATGKKVVPVLDPPREGLGKFQRNQNSASISKGLTSGLSRLVTSQGNREYPRISQGNFEF